MSLKAKLEAVIYAAEEPVTLAQLAALFAADALEWRAAASAEAACRTDASQESDSFQLIPNELEYIGLDAPEAVPLAIEPSAMGAPTEPEAVSVLDSSPDSSPETNQEANQEPSLEPTLAAESPADAELEARRLARLRDREVRAILRQLLDELIASYASDASGIEIREIAGGFRMATKPECHDAVRAFIRSQKPALKLSLPALETLAVIAYKQPVTAPEVNEIRGVDSSGVFGSLLARKLISTAGRKQVIGRPILYKTTREFLLRFGLKDLSELPSMEEFEKMAAIELDEPELVSSRESAPPAKLNPRLGPDETEEEADEVLIAPPPTLEATRTAATAAYQEPTTATPAIQAQPTLAEAAPASPSPTVQAETEISPDAEEDKKDDDAERAKEDEQGEQGG